MTNPSDCRFDPFTETYSAVSITDEDQAVPGASPYQIRLDEVPREDSPSSMTAVILVQLDEDLDASETGVDVLAAEYDRVQVDDVLLCDSEQMQVTAKPGSPTLTCTRGYGGTTPATHTTGTEMEILNSLTEITSGAPASREFRVDYKYNTGLVLFNSAQAEYDVRFDYYGLGSPLHAVDLVSPQMMKNGALPAFNMYVNQTISETTAWGAQNDTFAQIKTLIPEGATMLQCMLFGKCGATSTLYARLHCDTEDSDIVSWTTGSNVWKGPVSLDLSSFGGEYKTIVVRAYKAGTNNGTLYNVHTWWE